MTIYYLYVKTHNITGLKYLGQTSSNNPSVYKGSGKYWRAHLNVHGFNIKTEILRECATKEEVKYWGKHFSTLWNIVSSNEWANLAVENGYGGATRNGMKNKPRSLESRAKTVRANIGRIHSFESRMKNRESNLGENNGMFGKSHSSSAKQKMSEFRIGKPNVNKGKVLTVEDRKRISEGCKLVSKINCKYCGLASSPGNHSKWHGNNCKLNTVDY